MAKASRFVIRDGSRYFVGILRMQGEDRVWWTDSPTKATKYTSREKAWAEVNRLPPALGMTCNVEAYR